MFTVAFGFDCVIWPFAMAILAHDVGTSSVKSVLCETNGTIIAAATHPLALLTPRSGWCEQDPQAWLQAIGANCQALLAGTRRSIDAIGFAAQTQGTVLVDASGHALHPSMIWLDMRAASDGLAAVARWQRTQGRETTNSGTKRTAVPGLAFQHRVPNSERQRYQVLHSLHSNTEGATDRGCLRLAAPALPWCQGNLLDCCRSGTGASDPVRTFANVAASKLTLT